MIFKNALGREIEVSFSGFYDDIECDYAVYVDDGSDASDEDVEYIMDAYAEEIEFAGLERAIMHAEDAYDAARGH